MRDLKSENKNQVKLKKKKPECNALVRVRGSNEKNEFYEWKSISTLTDCENSGFFFIDGRKLYANNGVITSITDDEFYKIEAKNEILTTLCARN